MIINRSIKFKLARLYRIKNIFMEIEFLPSVIKGQTYYPECKRKNKIRILMDNIIWLIRNKEINKFYYAYGLDRINVDIKNYCPYSLFYDLRNIMNFYPIKQARFNYVCLLRDKLIFNQYLKSLNVPTPDNIALCFRNEVV